MGAWTSDEIDHAVQLRRNGWSAGRIAEDLEQRYGRPFTRNAVLGKMHRTGVDAVTLRVTTLHPLQWRPDEETKLEAVHRLHSYRELGEMFSRSANSIADKLRRMGLKLVNRKLDTSLKSTPIRSFLAVHEPALDTCPPTAVPLLEVTGCRWPYGEGAAMLFCDAEQERGHPYCGRHCAAAYNTRAAA